VRDRVAEAVKEGHLTQEQADQRLTDLEQQVTDWVNSTSSGPWDGGRGGWWGKHDD
jgi:hypothetical protein